MRFVSAAEEGFAVGDFEVARVIAEAIELLAIAVISVAVIAACLGTLRHRFRSDPAAGLEAFKRTMARGLLIGLDLLIAADIVKTVTLEPTLENAVVLALLVLIRTFLSWALVLEVEERWPWQPKRSDQDDKQKPAPNSSP